MVFNSQDRGYHRSNHSSGYDSSSKMRASISLTNITGWVGVTEIGDGIREWVNKYHPSLENLTVEKSAGDCMKVLNTLTIDDAGEFFNHDGTKLPF